MSLAVLHPQPQRTLRLRRRLVLRRQQLRGGLQEPGIRLQQGHQLGLPHCPHGQQVNTSCSGVVPVLRRRQAVAEHARNSCKRAGAIVKKRQIPASSAGMTLGYVRQDMERVCFLLYLLKKENNNHEWKNRNPFWSGR